MTTPAPKPRWYRLTHDRFLIGLLVVECLLWLSEWFQRFPFNYGKGWTVLIAVAVVAATILLFLLGLIASLLFRGRFQFGIRSLFLLTILVAIPCSWFAVEVRLVAREQEIGAELGELGVAVGWSRYPSGPVWLQGLLGDDFFYSIVNLTGCTQVTDVDLETFTGLNQLGVLDLNKSASHRHGPRASQGADPPTPVSRQNPSDGRGLEHLKGLNQLRELDLGRTRVTDAGLRHLKGLNRLRTRWSLSSPTSRTMG